MVVLLPEKQLMKNTAVLSSPQRAVRRVPRPSIPDQEDLQSRTASFAKWPRGKGVKVSELVNSGFSYLGVTDRVQCFHCGEIFENWREGENVDVQHEQLSPNCVFIKYKLGKVVEPLPPLYPNERIVTTSGDKRVLEQEAVRSVLNMTQMVDVPAGMLNAPRNRFPVAPRDIRARLDIPSSRKLLDMGFKKTLLAQVIGERLAETGDDFHSFMDYFLAVKTAEQILSGGQVDTLKSFYNKSVERLSNPSSLVTEEPTSQTPAIVTSSNNISTGSTGSNVSLVRKKECNICMDAEADTVFMPCRHMCACATCADKLTDCPICRKSIEHCIRVYV